MELPQQHTNIIKDIFIFPHNLSHSRVVELKFQISLIQMKKRLKNMVN